MEIMRIFRVFMKVFFFGFFLSGLILTAFLNTIGILKFPFSQQQDNQLYGMNINQFYLSLYEELTNPRYNVCSFDQYLSYDDEEKHEQVYVILRHDVDIGPTPRMIKNVINLMLIEKKHGLNSSFFFLTYFEENNTWDESYDCYSFEAIKLIKKLHDNGFEVGIHANWYTAELSGEVENATEFMIEDIRHFEEVMNINVVGISAHGSPRLYGVDACNFDIYKDKDPSVFGLTYYAYFVEKYLYLSDAGGNKINIIELENASLGKTIIINIHACYPNYSDETIEKMFNSSKMST